MADDQTKLIISIETILRNLDKTLRGLSQVEKQLKSVASIKIGAQSTANFDKATQAAQKLQQQQQRLAVQAQELANREEKARQTTIRLAQAKERLAQASAKAAAASGKQADAHVREFRAQQAALQADLRAFKQRQAEVNRINAQTAREATRQEKIRERAAKNLSDIQTKEAKRAADSFIKSLQDQERAAGALNARMQSVGNSLRSFGQGLSSFGFALTAALTVPLVALGKSSLDAAVTIDSLKRGLTAIVGSADEASTQLTRLTKIAKLPGIGFEEAIQGSIRLQAVGFSAADAEKALIQFSNAVALTGGGREELSRITVQLGQLAAKGKVLSQDLRPIIEAAPKVGTALLAAFGTVNADDIADLTTNSREFLDTLVKELERLPRAASGAKNTFENFRDTMFRTVSIIGDAMIPVLTRLASVAEATLVPLANAFKALPSPVQTLVVLFGGLGAAAGPMLFIFGQLTTGAGRLIVSLTQLSALGILPVIANFRLMGQVAVGTASLVQGAAATTAAASVAMGGVVAAGVAVAAVLVTVAVALGAFSKASKDAVQIADEQVRILNEQVESLKKQASFLDNLSDGVKRTADEQSKLDAIYRQLNTQAQIRVEGVDSERERLEKLREEIEKLIKLRTQERQQSAATLAAGLVQTLSQIDANEREIDSITKQIAAHARLKESLTAQGIATETVVRTQANGRTVVTTLTAENERLLGVQKGLRDATNELNSTGEQQARTLAALEAQGVGNARQFLELARNMGLFTGSIDEALGRMDLFIKGQEDSADAADDLTSALKRQKRELDSLFEQSKKSRKEREEVVGNVANFIRENAQSLADAKATLSFFISTIPGFSEQFRKELKLTGKTADEFLADIFKTKKESGTSLRNAQESLADAVAKVSQELAEKEIATEKSKNDELLRLNDSRFKQELIGFKEFIKERSRLQQLEIQGEIERQRKVAELAGQDIARQQQRAGVAKGAEQVRAQAQIEASKAKQIEAETKILDLQSRQKDIAADAENDLRQFNKDRLRDFRELSRELDEILGKEKAAGEAAIDERFRETLQELTNERRTAINREAEQTRAESRIKQLEAQKEQASLEDRIRLTGELTAETDKLVVILAASDIEEVQAGIDKIENLKRQLKAVVALRAAKEEISQAEERQSNLERDLAFQVEFRGLSEREAVRQRLEGEKLVRAEIEKQQAALKEVILTLKRAGLEVPLGLLEGLERFKVAAKGLGESSFAEQFKLAEVDLGKTQDLLAAKVHGVELAVRSRAIAEVQGRVAVRRFNNEYIEQLEREVSILEEIAAKSNDASLQRQAQSARQTVNEIRAAADEMENFSQQLKSVAIDSFADSLSQLFKDLRDNTESATQDILNFFNNILNRVNDFIAENLAQRIAESLFPDPNAPKGKGGGILSTVKELFGFGGDKAATAATGAASITTASAALSTSITAAAATFAATVTAAGAAFAASVGVSSGVSSASGILNNFAKGDIIAPVPRGRTIRVAEAGHAEAVLTSDPRYALKQAEILRRFLRMTRGLSGHFNSVPEFAEGGIISARDAEANLLASLSASRTPSLAASIPTELATRSDSAPSVNFRNINLFDRREMVRGYMRSAEGTQDFLNQVSENADEIGRRIRVR